MFGGGTGESDTTSGRIAFAPVPNTTYRFRDASNVANLPAATINASGGYTITKVSANTYTFNSGVTASVTLDGGGDIASAGPVTVSA